MNTSLPYSNIGKIESESWLSILDSENNLEEK